ncbi:endolytic transglycosylase MltG [Sinomicrobium pectinilyticum]|uniref:Endolytic murein transglycosylase n=1 Tax=Sinomicrobium pectinilyticum TaxID=1084421 RepID=A0A3N0E1J5_SINP1|nr:endolytic transglycosylase MltG [Sinomicrobium pectinilyticum]RNL81701.1 endolytic transglycosylase MltG [Sinomicrobium pectinilyticum]
MYIRKIIVAVLLLGVVLGLVFVYRIYTAIFAPNTGFNNDEAYVYVSTGANFSEVREQLEPLLKNIRTFEKVAERKGYVANPRAGKYVIKKGMSNNDIVNTLRSRNTPVNVSFNNQETLEKLAGRIAAQIEADSVELVDTFRDTVFLDSLRLTEDQALGLYIPNSYEFFWDTSAKEFRQRMVKEYDRFWNEERLARARAQNLSRKDVITLASIVQKETARADERPRVAGVYLNRLRSNILLQADPTVIYALKRHTGDYDTIIKRVLYKDLEIDSPYNTYKYAGLPPGPIAMPDISSIDAVLNPEKHDYYYFVADINQPGYHKFSKTLTQHNVNKREYVNWLNRQKVHR